MKAEGGSHGMVLLSLPQSNLTKTRNGSQMVENFSNELILSIFPERKLGRVISLPWISSRRWQDRLEGPFSTCRIFLSRAEPERESQCTFCLIVPVAQWWDRQVDLVQAWLEVMKPVDNCELNPSLSAGNTTRLLSRTASGCSLFQQSKVLILRALTQLSSRAPNQETMCLESGGFFMRSKKKVSHSFLINPHVPAAAALCSRRPKIAADFCFNWTVFGSTVGSLQSNINNTNANNVLIKLFCKN